MGIWRDENDKLFSRIKRLLSESVKKFSESCLGVIGAFVKMGNRVQIHYIHKITSILINRVMYESKKAMDYPDPDKYPFDEQFMFCVYEFLSTLAKIVFI